MPNPVQLELDLHLPAPGLHKGKFRRRALRPTARTMRDEYRRGLEDAADIVDFYSIENFRLADDMWLVQTAQPRDFSPEAERLSEQLTYKGTVHASIGYVTVSIANAIRCLPGSASLFKASSK